MIANKLDTPREIIAMACHKYQNGNFKPDPIQQALKQLNEYYLGVALEVIGKDVRTVWEKGTSTVTFPDARAEVVADYQKKLRQDFKRRFNQ